MLACRMCSIIGAPFSGSQSAARTMPINAKTLFRPQKSENVKDASPEGPPPHVGLPRRLILCEADVQRR